MSDLRAVIDSVRQLQEDRAVTDAESSATVERLLASASALLEGSQNGNRAVLTEPVYDAEFHEDIRRRLQVVRQIASDLRNGRY
jgi:hypothetical protein